MVDRSTADQVDQAGTVGNSSITEPADAVKKRKSQEEVRETTPERRDNGSQIKTSRGNRKRPDIHIIHLFSKANGRLRSSGGYRIRISSGRARLTIAPSMDLG